MGDLLKTMRSSQLFSVTGLPDLAIRRVDPEEKGGLQRYEVELLGLDTFDPTTFEAQHRSGDDVPAWFLDTAWNGLSFHVSQAFFPRTSAGTTCARRSRPSSRSQSGTTSRAKLARRSRRTARARLR